MVGTTINGLRGWWSVITGFVGLPGSGKTLGALWQMEQWVRAGCTVATNIRLTEYCPYFDDVFLLDDDAGECPVFELPKFAKVDGSRFPVQTRKYRAWWHYMPPGVKYVIDEADNYFDSMDFAKLAEMADDARLYFKQHRKRGDDIVWITQNPENLWNRIRRMTQSFWLCEHNWRSRPLFQSFFPITWSSFMRTEFAKDDFSERSRVREGYFSYGEAQRMFRWYATDQIVGGAELYNWSNGNEKPVGVGEAVGAA